MRPPLRPASTLAPSSRCPNSSCCTQVAGSVHARNFPSAGFDPGPMDTVMPLRVHVNRAQHHIRSTIRRLLRCFWPGRAITLLLQGCDQIPSTDTRQCRCMRAGWTCWPSRFRLRDTAGERLRRGSLVGARLLCRDQGCSMSRGCRATPVRTEQQVKLHSAAHQSRRQHRALWLCRLLPTAASQSEVHNRTPGKWVRTGCPVGVTPSTRCAGSSAHTARNSTAQYTSCFRRTAGLLRRPRPAATSRR